mmetsp:Transcript_14843/g.34873  ORF Transcript_14843/g.34873 Transcript_14843/m.34873 type:complete len:260 (-) Transcript_14843:1488-2267(-)
MFPGLMETVTTEASAPGGRCLTPCLYMALSTVPGGKTTSCSSGKTESQERLEPISTARDTLMRRMIGKESGQWSATTPTFSAADRKPIVVNPLWASGSVPSASDVVPGRCARPRIPNASLYHSWCMLCSRECSVLREGGPTESVETWRWVLSDCTASPFSAQSLGTPTQRYLVLNLENSCATHITCRSFDNPLLIHLTVTGRGCCSLSTPCQNGALIARWQLVVKIRSAATSHVRSRAALASVDIAKSCNVRPSCPRSR